MLIKHILLPIFIQLVSWTGNGFSHPLADIHAICERYVECKSISTLDEKLCIGNSNLMPMWLPPLNENDVTAQICHENLKPYYKKLELLEMAESNQLLSCLLEQTTPMNFDTRNECQRDLLNSPKFNYSGNKMDRIPTNCFQGIAKRIERQCGLLKQCCKAVDACSNFEHNETAKKIKQIKKFIQTYGKSCQLGLEIGKPEFNLDEEGEIVEGHQPTGNINITVRNQEDPPKIQSAPVHVPENQNRLVIRLLPAEEEIERLLLEGDDMEAGKLQQLLDEATGLAFKKPGLTTKSENKLATTTSTEATTTSSTEKSTTTSTAEKVTTTSTQKATTTSTTETPTTTQKPTTSTVTETTTKPTTTSSTTQEPTTTTSSAPEPTTAQSDPQENTHSKFITASPEEIDDQELISISYTTASPAHDYPKTLRTNAPLDNINDQLKKFAHVKTLNKLVQQFRDGEIESVLQPDALQNESKSTTTTITPLIDQPKLQQFFEKWETSVRGKVIKKAGKTSDPEAVSEYSRLLRTLSKLRSAIYKNDNDQSNNLLD